MTLLVKIGTSGTVDDSFRASGEELFKPLAASQGVRSRKRPTHLPQSSQPANPSLPSSLARPRPDNKI
jgi:hypothetical protein